MEKVGIHPNNYFESSAKLYRKETDKPLSNNYNTKKVENKIAYENPIDNI